MSGFFPDEDHDDEMIRLYAGLEVTAKAFTSTNWIATSSVVTLLGAVPSVIISASALLAVAAVI